MTDTEQAWEALRAHAAGNEWLLPVRNALVDLEQEAGRNYGLLEALRGVVAAQGEGSMRAIARGALLIAGDPPGPNSGGYTT